MRKRYVQIDGELVEVRLDLVGEVLPPFLDGPTMLGIPCVRDPLEEEEGEDVRLEVGGVDRPSERVGRVPKAALELLSGYARFVHQVPSLVGGSAPDQLRGMADAGLRRTGPMMVHR